MIHEKKNAPLIIIIHKAQINFTYIDDEDSVVDLVKE